MNIEDILKEMIKHSEENPTHAWNCSCKTKYLHEAGRVIEGMGSQENDVVYSNAAYLFDYLASSL
jgi:hypothetical protein